jgi:hypothetical protein
MVPSTGTNWHSSTRCSKNDCYRSLGHGRGRVEQKHAKTIPLLWERRKFAKPPAAIVVAFNSILEFDKRSHNR